MDKKVRGRFAPSPSGRMHLGNIFSALLAWLSIRAQGGTLVLRIEDLDPDRCRVANADQICDDLRWLGLTWDEGYQAKGTHGPYLQSQRTEHYAKAFDRLDRLGLVYPCYCTRAERLAASAPHRSDGQAVYDGRCRALTAEERERRAQTRRPAWRLSVADREEGFTDGLMGYFVEHLRRDCGDFIIRRSDGIYAYQLAVVADDGAMEITEVVRGQDLLDSTPRQRYLAKLLDLPEPVYYHVPLLLAPNGRRLSKRDGDLDLGALRAHLSAEQVVGTLAALAGIIPRRETVRPEELIPEFSWKKVRQGDIVISADVLNLLILD